MESMYGQYIKERLNKNIIENEKGFATYYFIKESCYIEDIYVLPEFRKSDEATNLANQIVEIALKNGCKKLVGSVVPSTQGSTTSLKVLLSYGFVLDSAINNFIVLSKEI